MARGPSHRKDQAGSGVLKAAHRVATADSINAPNLSRGWIARDPAKPSCVSLLTGLLSDKIPVFDITNLEVSYEPEAN